MSEIARRVGVALSAWLLAAALTFLVVDYLTFFGVAVVGLIVCYIGFRVEMDEVPSAVATSGIGATRQAERHPSVEQSYRLHHEQSLASQWVRFFKLFGLGLAIIGLGGGIHYQL